MPRRPPFLSRITYSQQLALGLELVRWIPVCALVGALAGSASAFLLWSLARATAVRERHPALILLLPLAGGVVGLLYRHLGASVEAGNNLILEEIHDPRQTIPLRMTPLILLGTILTHLFGGSAGREGTAIQTGASLADQLARPLRRWPAWGGGWAGGWGPQHRRTLLMTGISAGFGSVFGTPLAGAVFGIEVLALGQMTYGALAPCLLASFAGDLVTRAWSVQHQAYPVALVPPMSVGRLLTAMAAGVLFGLVGMAFARTTHALAALARQHIPSAPLRPVVGGAIVTVAVFGLGLAHTSRYLGLGISTIVAAFTGKVAPWDFAGKFAFTVVTLGSGFKGGEVTPLFYIGATLGNALANVLPLPPALLAGMGFAAVFAGAANTPLAATLMAVELFGAPAGAYAGVACVMSYLCSGHRGIYGSQRVGLGKYLRGAVARPEPLAEAEEAEAASNADAASK